MSKSNELHIEQVTERWLLIKSKLNELFKTGQHSNLQPVVSPTSLGISIPQSNYRYSLYGLLSESCQCWY